MLISSLGADARTCSVFLGDISAAYKKDPKLENLLFDDFFNKASACLFGLPGEALVDLSCFRSPQGPAWFVLALPLCFLCPC